MPENFVPLHTEIERISSGNIQPQDVADYYVRHGKLSPYEATPTPITGDSYDEYEQSIWSDFAGEVWNNSVVSATRGLAEYIPLTGLANNFRKGFTPNERIASVAKLIGKEDAYRNSWVGKILGGLDEGYKKIGADYITKPLSDALPSALFDALPKTLMGEEGRNKFFEDWIANVDKITEGMKAPVTDGKSFFQDPSARSFVKGMGQGIGFMASVLLTKKWGTAPSMAVSVTQMAPMYYDEAKNAGLTSEQAASFATALAPVIGATEYFGLDMVGKVAMKPALNALRKESVVAGAKAFSRVLEESGSGQKALNAAIAESNSVFGKSLKTIGIATASGAAIEGGEEFGQTYIEEGYKQYFDKVILPNAKFNSDIFSKDALLKASEGAFFGGILGGLLGGGHGVFSAPSNQEVVQQSMFNIMDASNNKEKALRGILSNVENAKNKGTISDKEYEGAQRMAKSLYEYVNSLPVSLTDTTAKYQAYQFISERNMLAEQLDALNKKGGDPVLATADDDIRNFLQGGIEVYNTAIETIGKTKGQVSNAEIERQITELRDKYLPTSRDIETTEEGVGEAVATGAEGIEMPAVEPLEVGAKMSRDEYDARMADIEAMRAQELEQFKDSLNEPIAAGSEQTIGQRIEDNYNQEIQKLNVQYEKEIYSVNDKNKVKPGVSELFDSDPELANDVYEALGFRKNIQFNEEDKINDFKNDKNTTVINVNDILNKETDPVTKELIKVLTPYLNKNTKIYYQDDYIFKGSSELALESSYAATIDGKGNILVFNKDYLNTDSVLHELMHDFLLDAININKDEVLINELTRIFNKAKTDTDLVERYSYAFSNLDEFVSEVFGNKGFRQELSYVKDYSLNKTSNIFQSVSNAIKDFLKRTFNFEISNTLLDSIFNAIESSVKNKNQITPQQKQQAQQLYSQYLDSIFPDSKVSKQDIEGFKKFVSKKEKDVEPLSEGVQGLRAEEERGKESPELRAEEEKVIKAQADLIEFENILERNQNNINDLRTKKLRKGETQEKRDMAIANLEEQNRILQEKIGGLREQVSATPSIAPSARAVFQQIQILRDNITSKGGKRKEKKEKFSKFVESQDEGIRQISDNFKEIVNQLESKGLLTKSSPEC